MTECHLIDRSLYYRVVKWGRWYWHVFFFQMWEQWRVGDKLFYLDMPFMSDPLTNASHRQGRRRRKWPRIWLQLLLMSEMRNPSVGPAGGFRRGNADDANWKHVQQRCRRWEVLSYSFFSIDSSEIFDSTMWPEEFSRCNRSIFLLRIQFPSYAAFA